MKLYFCEQDNTSTLINENTISTRDAILELDKFRTKRFIYSSSVCSVEKDGDKVRFLNSEGITIGYLDTKG